MKQIIIALLIAFPVFSHAQEFDSTQWKINQIEQSIKYQTGKIDLDNATLTVPAGFQFLDKEQSNFVLTDLWGNPPDSSILGMLVPEGHGILGDSSWAFTVSFDEMGYVKDDDAEDIDYDDLLKEQQKEMKDGNAERIKQGYQPIDFIGWASAPYYDKDKKILHWAKEVKFGSDSTNTLNYNLRMLGRKGIFVLNAVASMNELPQVKASINNVVASVEFKDGHKYADFIPDVDNVAAWTIGGLVAGKILAKTGFFLGLLKFWKVIALAATSGAAALWRTLTGRRKEEETPADPGSSAS